MRSHGTLVKWNDDRGFGFIASAQGSKEIFVHVSAFPRDGRRPQINELVSFETEAGPDGRLRAVRIMRPRHQAESPQPRPGRSVERPTWPSGLVLGLLAVTAIGGYGYSRINRSVPVSPAASMSTAAPAVAESFRCDGRTRCSEMTSCREARQFLQHCPNTQMDGDNDGVPCEQQLCGSQ